MRSVWFDAGGGPLLEATAKIRDAFKRCCDDERLDGRYRLRESRWVDGKREVEIIYDGSGPGVKEMI